MLRDKFTSIPVGTSFLWADDPKDRTIKLKADKTSYRLNINGLLVDLLDSRSKDNTGQDIVYFPEVYVI